MLQYGFEVRYGHDRRLHVCAVHRTSPAAECGVQKDWALIGAEDSNRNPIALADFFHSSLPMPDDVRCDFEDKRGQKVSVHLRASRKRSAHTQSRSNSARRTQDTSWGDMRQEEEPDVGGASKVGRGQIKKRERTPPKRFSSSPIRGPLWASPLRILRSISPPRRESGLLGTIVGLFKRPIQSIEPGSSEAKAACRRVWRGWNIVRGDDAIIMRKEYPPECVERFQRLRRQYQTAYLADMLESWQEVAHNRRAEFLCALRIMQLSIRDLQGRALSEWALVTKNVERSEASRPTPQAGRPGFMEVDSSIHSQATSSPTYLPQIIEIVSSTGRSPSSTPVLTSSGSWFFGLFGSNSSPIQADAGRFQEQELVCTPKIPSYVLGMWPDLDLDSYVVQTPGSVSPDTKKQHNSSEDKTGKESPAEKTVYEVMLAKMQMTARQTEMTRELMVASRNRILSLGSRPGLVWLKTTVDIIMISDRTMAKHLMEQNNWNSSRALAEFTVEYIGIASANQVDKLASTHVFKAWRLVFLSARLQILSAGTMRRKILLKLKGRAFWVWRQVSVRSRFLLQVSAASRFKCRKLLLQSFFSNWADTARNRLDSDDDGAERANGLTHLFETGSSAGRAILGDRGVAVGLVLGAKLGELLIGHERFQTVLAKFSPSPPKLEPRYPSSSPSRAVSLSPMSVNNCTSSRESDSGGPGRHSIFNVTSAVTGTPHVSAAPKQGDQLSHYIPHENVPLGGRKHPTSSQAAVQKQQPRAREGYSISGSVRKEKVPYNPPRSRESPLKSRPESPLGSPRSREIPLKSRPASPLGSPRSREIPLKSRPASPLGRR
jgi:hypothetical protein